MQPADCQEIIASTSPPFLLLNLFNLGQGDACRLAATPDYSQPAFQAICRLRPAPSWAARIYSANPSSRATGSLCQ